MKIAVWDTYVPRKMRSGESEPTIMHFDILVPTDTGFDRVQQFGRIFLAEKGESDQPISATECRFCHVESASQAVVNEIQRRGFSIIEMQGCEPRGI
ncbi:MAG: DUF2024 family protein [Bacteroidetes bacterium]|nr:DUF2024 family protein [Bacteroidota bacterium]